MAAVPERSTWLGAALLVSATVVSYQVGFLAGLPLLVPVLNVLPAVPSMLNALARESVRRAIVLMLVWAATLIVCATALSYAFPEETGRLFLNGDRYQREMFNWVITGQGAESRPRDFLPLHAAHAALFVSLSLVTGSLLSLAMGAVLVNYMGHFVGTLGAVSSRPILTMILAWNPWSLTRIVSFVTLGVVLSGPLLSRLGGFRFRLGDHWRLIALACAGLVVDVLLKAVLAPSWQQLLRSVTGF
jgi:hypothetical protein